MPSRAIRKSPPPVVIPSLRPRPRLAPALPSPAPRPSIMSRAVTPRRSAVCVLAGLLALSGCQSPPRHRADCDFDCPHEDRHRKADALAAYTFGGVLLTGFLLGLFEDEAPVGQAAPVVSAASADGSLSVTSSEDGRQFSDETRNRIAHSPASANAVEKGPRSP